MGIVLLLVSLIIVQSSQDRLANQLPDWVRKQFDQLTANNGTWRCENTTYKASNEPFDAYALQWTYAFGKRAISGEMFAIQNEKVIGKIWQFYSYWDAKQKKLIAIQFASDGTTGIGETSQDQSRDKTIQDFFPADAANYSVGHESWFDNEGHHTQSYNIINGKWVKRRGYVWKNVDSFVKEQKHAK